MQERLEKWRKDALPAVTAVKVRGPEISRRSGKNDYGDAMSCEEWEEEHKRSQTRK